MSKFKKVFSKQGLKAYKKLLEEQEKKSTKALIDMGVANATDGWHENSAFDEAYQRAGVEGSQLYEMKNIVENSVVSEPKEQNKVVSIGNTVKYLNIFLGQNNKITIGAFGESNFELKIFSYESPLALALLNKKVGQKSSFQVEESLVGIEILKIFPPSYQYREILKKLY